MVGRLWFVRRKVSSSRLVIKELVWLLSSAGSLARKKKSVTNARKYKVIMSLFELLITAIS